MANLASSRETKQLEEGLSQIEQVLKPDFELAAEKEGLIVNKSEKKPSEVAKPSHQQPVASSNTVNQANAQSEKMVKAIEDILEEDLNEVYFALPPQEQIIFKQEGEKAARKIFDLLKGVTIKVREVIRAIAGWLKVIPGINRFFLEQEVKIKTAKILKLTGRDKKLK
ncbi:MAG: hypothetical protein WCW02_00825 [Candidatus Buchananbacteria bacterium]